MKSSKSTGFFKKLASAFLAIAGIFTGSHAVKNPPEYKSTDNVDPVKKGKNVIGDKVVPNTEAAYCRYDYWAT